MGGETVTIGVAGAGTMGTGIAQIAAAAGHQVILFDVNAQALTASLRQIECNLARQIERERISNGEMNFILARVKTTGTVERFSDCRLIIEAVAEDLAVKRELLCRIEEVVDPSCILGTNTSSLSVTAISSVLKHRDRCLGTHFFNPANLMPLVELVRLQATPKWVIIRARDVIEGWGKTTVIVKDTPGFIVNRIARPFYLEALRILEEGTADIATIDWAMRECAGFKMGPFELMDFIGNDVNHAVSKSIYESFDRNPRFRPSDIQRKLVEEGLLGRKTGEGFYDYSEHAPKPQPLQDRAQAEKISRRVVLMIINEAADAAFHRIASVEQIDLAMVKGVSYPRGPLRWADEIGIPEVVNGLEGLWKEFANDRYRPAALLSRMMKSGTQFYSR